MSFKEKPVTGLLDASKTMETAWGSILETIAACLAFGPRASAEER
jgi:hypothetical protein